MAMNRTQFNTLLNEGLREVFWMQYKAKPEVYTKLYEIKSSKKKDETDYSVAALGMLTEKEEGLPITYDEYIPGYSTTYTHTAYAKGIRFTREVIDDELYGVMSNRTKALARSARYRKEYDHASLFNNASGTTVFTGGDGKALLATDHPLAGGGVYANTPASGTDLSLTALESAVVNFKRIVDDRGLLIGITPRVLLVPPESGFDAAEMIKSVGKSGTDYNDINVFKDRFEIVEWDMLTDTDCWFLLADKSDGAPISFNRTPVEFATDGDFDTKDLKASVYTRYSFGFSDWRWCYGSMGNG